MNKLYLAIVILLSILRSTFELTLNLLLRPDKWFKRKTTPLTKPDCLLDKEYGEHKYIKVNGITLHYVVSGPIASPLIIMLHGLPEFWYSWRHQIKYFNKDYRVVAVDMRGYAQSEKPLRLEAYKISILVNDVIELVSSLGYGSCILIGHDWGGIVGWYAVAARPDLFQKYIAIAAPHPKRYLTLIDYNFAVLYRQWYTFAIQVRGLFNFYFTFNNHEGLKKTFLSQPHGVVNTNNFTLEDINAYIWTYARSSDFDGGLNYVKSAFRVWDLDKPCLDEKIRVPTLMIWGLKDMYFHPKLLTGNHEFVENLQIKSLPCSHWVQQDFTDEVNQIISEYIT